MVKQLLIRLLPPHSGLISKGELVGDKHLRMEQQLEISEAKDLLFL